MPAWLKKLLRFAWGHRDDIIATGKVIKDKRKGKEGSAKITESGR